MLDLMAATGAGRHEDGSVRLGLDFFDERLRDFQRKFIFGFQHAKSAGHAAAAGFQQRDFPLRQALRQSRHEGGARQVTWRGNAREWRPLRASD